MVRKRNIVAAGLVLALMLGIGLTAGNLYAGHADTTARAAHMATGTGQNFTILPPAGAGVWNEMHHVTIRPRADGICVVTASWTAFLGGNRIQTTIDTSANTRGPWVQVHDNAEWDSSAMVNAFEVKQAVPVSFYMNGENRGTTDVSMENTRIWVICSRGGIIPLPPISGTASGGGTGIGN